MQYALNYTARTLTEMEELFGIKYALSKLDLIVSESANAGSYLHLSPASVSKSLTCTAAGAAAMEHWGCITYYKPYFISVDATGSHECMSLQPGG